MRLWIRHSESSPRRNPIDMNLRLESLNLPFAQALPLKGHSVRDRLADRTRYSCAARFSQLLHTLRQHYTSARNRVIRKYFFTQSDAHTYHGQDAII